MRRIKPGLFLCPSGHAQFQSLVDSSVSSRLNLASFDSISGNCRHSTLNIKVEQLLALVCTIEKTLQNTKK